MLMGGAEWMRSVNVMRPYWWVRTFTGIAMDIGISLVVYTLMKTSLRASAPTGAGR
jgi:cytochrome c oxidase cbb3-type subunit 1